MTEAENINLIIAKEPIKLRLFRPRPNPEPGIALVLYREGQPLVTLWPGDQLTSGEIKWGNYNLLYRVDITEHSFDFKCSIPCHGEAFEFHADVDVSYSVKYPNIIVEKNISNANSIIKRLIVDSMRVISREFEIEQSAEAEKEIKKRLLNEINKIKSGFKIDRLLISLSLEEEARYHIRQLKQIDRDKEQGKKKAELDQQRLKFEMVLMKQKMNFYGPMIKEGHWQMLALQLSNNPQDVASVAKMVRENNQVEFDNQLKALKIMLDSDVIENFQMEEASKRVLQRFVEHFEPDIKKIGSKENGITNE